MISCNKNKSLIKKAVNNELTVAENNLLIEHTEKCEVCSEELSELKATLAAIKQYNRPEPDEQFLGNLWDTISLELVKPKSAIYNSLETIKNFIDQHILSTRWTYQLAGALSILVLGVFIGKYILSSDNNTQIGSAASSIETSRAALQVKTENYIDRSKVLLLGLTNFDPAFDDVGTINLQQQKKISRELLTYAADLKSEMDLTKQNNLRELVSDLEFILLQIANLESEQDIDGIELVKEGVDRRGIFLKINIHEMLGSRINSSEPDKSNENEKKEI